MPAPASELDHETPYQLLIATMLAAQCTDRRVNMVTPALFERWPSAAELAAAAPGEVFEYIKSVSYPNAKARHLVAAARMLTDDFGGLVPDAADALQRLPGVGRKTANVVLAVAFGRDAMPVDTHVFRVAARLGLTRGARTPLETERQLVRHIPAGELGRAHHWLLLHGRYVCLARRPKCAECGISGYCKYFTSKS
jgi:endonuclease-3